MEFFFKVVLILSLLILERRFLSYKICNSIIRLDFIKLLVRLKPETNTLLFGIR